MGSTPSLFLAFLHTSYVYVASPYSQSLGSNVLCLGHSTPLEVEKAPSRAPVLSILSGTWLAVADLVGLGQRFRRGIRVAKGGGVG